MYSTKTATISAQEFTSSYMPVGINENVTLKDVTVEKTPNGRDFIRIVFENEAGQTAEMTEWKNEKNMWIKTDEDLQKRDDQQFGRLLQIVDSFGIRPEFEGSSFLEMITWVKDLLLKYKAMANNPKLRLKVVYDKKGFTKVSNLGVFVEPMTTEQSQIKLWKNDLLERPIIADVEIEPATDPLAVQTPSDFGTPVTETSTGADDLPF